MAIVKLEDALNYVVLHDVMYTRRNADLTNRELVGRRFSIAIK